MQARWAEQVVAVEKETWCVLVGTYIKAAKRIQHSKRGFSALIKSFFLEFLSNHTQDPTLTRLCVSLFIALHLCHRCRKGLPEIKHFLARQHEIGQVLILRIVCEKKARRQRKHILPVFILQKSGNLSGTVGTPNRPPGKKKSRPYLHEKNKPR